MYTHYRVKFCKGCCQLRRHNVETKDWCKKGFYVHVYICRTCEDTQQQISTHKNEKDIK